MMFYQTRENGQRCWYLQDGKAEPRSVDFLAGLAEFHGSPAAPEPVPEGIPFCAPFAGTKILCVGRNYKPHVEELGNPLPKEPVWFSKPPSSLLDPNGEIVLPEEFGRIDYEGEMAILIGTRARNLHGDSQSLGCVAGVTVALDITARALQKADGQWTRAKGFDTFCPLGPYWVPFSSDWLDASIKTFLNGKLVQNDRTSSFIFPLTSLLVHISKCMTLEPGDVILTGTPAGVGPLRSGDHSAGPSGRP